MIPSWSAPITLAPSGPVSDGKIFHAKATHPTFRECLLCSGPRLMDGLTNVSRTPVYKLTDSEVNIQINKLMPMKTDKR
jgi:hypothetical protein